MSYRFLFRCPSRDDERGSVISTTLLIALFFAAVVPVLWYVMTEPMRQMAHDADLASVAMTSSVYNNVAVVRVSQGGFLEWRADADVSAALSGFRDDVLATTNYSQSELCIYAVKIERTAPGGGEGCDAFALTTDTKTPSDQVSGCPGSVPGPCLNRAWNRNDHRSTNNACPPAFEVVFFDMENDPTARFCRMVNAAVVYEPLVEVWDAP